MNTGKNNLKRLIQRYELEPTEQHKWNVKEAQMEQ